MFLTPGKYCHVLYPYYTGEVWYVVCDGCSRTTLYFMPLGDRNAKTKSNWSVGCVMIDRDFCSQHLRQLQKATSFSILLVYAPALSRLIMSTLCLVVITSFTVVHASFFIGRK